MGSDSVILALDIGDKRIGIARATTAARLPSPLTTLERSTNTLDRLNELAAQQAATVIVVGLPRSLEGNDTAQTTAVRQFAHELEKHTALPIYLQDEALTSRKAEQELRDRGVKYNREEVDALAATYILSDFLGDHPEV